MKFRYLILSGLVLAMSATATAQGYKDGIEYYKINKLDNAKELLLRNLNNASTNKAVAYYYLGCISIQANNNAEAKEYFEKGLAADAQNPYNHVGLGALALRENNLKAAEDDFDEARKLSKKDPKLEVEIARTYYDVDPAKYDVQIHKCIDKARKWNPKDPDSYILEGDMLARKQDWGGSVGLYELAMNDDPTLIEPYVKYADTYFHVPSSRPMAIQKLQELLKKHPNSALAQRELAEKYYEDNQGTKATEQYGEYIKNPNHFAQDVVRYVQLLFFTKQYQKSYDLASQLISKLDASDPTVFYMRRMQLYNLDQLQKWPEAVEAGKQFFAIPLPKGSEYEVRDYTDYAEALQNNKQPELAIAQYEKAVQLDPNKVDLLRGLGDAFSDKGDYVKAAEFYEKAGASGEGKLNDRFQAATNYFNEAVTTKDATEKAAVLAKANKIIDAAAAVAGDNDLILYRKAQIESFSEGKAEGKALATVNKLLDVLKGHETEPDKARYFKFAYGYLGEYYTNKGDTANANESYKSLLKYDPDNEALRKYVGQMK